MPNLVLELKPGEMMVVNGATIRFRSRCRVELLSKARFLFGKQLMTADDAETPLRRLYYTLQTAYAGPLEQRPAALQEGRSMLAALALDNEPNTRPFVDTICRQIEQDEFYTVLKLLRSMIRLEQSTTIDEIRIPKPSVNQDVLCCPTANSNGERQ